MLMAIEREKGFIYRALFTCACTLTLDRIIQGITLYFVAFNNKQVVYLCTASNYTYIISILCLI